MAREIPEVVRAVAGLAATVLDEARKLPETLPALPVRLIGQAMQASLRLQQQYSGLVARGDEVFTGLRGGSGGGFATFDEDLPAPPPRAGSPAPRSSAFDRVGDPGPLADLETELEVEILAEDESDSGIVAEELADELADDLAVAGLPLADAEALSDDVIAVLSLGADAEDLSPAEVAALPDDPAADELTAVVDELAAEVADEIAAELPEAVPDEIVEDLTAEAVTEVAEDEVAVEEAVAGDLVADAVVGGTPPADVAEVPSLGDLTSDAPPEQTQLVDEAAPEVGALEDAAQELVDLGGPEAAESVTPGSGITDSAASDPLVAPGTPEPATADVPAVGDQPAGDSAEPGGPTAARSPIEGYDSFSIPALRGRLRGYTTETVADLLDYERATRARAPYVTLLQNRLEKLSSDRG